MKIYTAQDWNLKQHTEDELLEIVAWNYIPKKK